jgi:hypothetical protein
VSLPQLAHTQGVRVTPVVSRLIKFVRMSHQLQLELLVNSEYNLEKPPLVASAFKRPVEGTASRHRCKCPSGAVSVVAREGCSSYKCSGVGLCILEAKTGSQDCSTCCHCLVPIGLTCNSSCTKDYVCMTVYSVLLSRIFEFRVAARPMV